jgi:hypothetical protein
MANGKREARSAAGETMVEGREFYRAVADCK